MTGLLLTSGCGVQASEQASTAGPGEVPFDLLSPETSTTSTTLPELTSTEVVVWFVAHDRLIALERTVPSPASVGRVLEALITGPTDGEAALGVRSALTGLGVRAAAASAGVATIELTSDFAEAPTREQLYALGQLVYTATGLRNVEVVTFEIDGTRVEVPRADGSLSDRPVTRADYASLSSGA
jgi:spore germination protein GerM